MKTRFISAGLLGSAILMAQFAFAQAPLLTEINCNPGSSLGSSSDDYIQFSIQATPPMSFFEPPFTYTVTATQNGSPVTVLQQNGSSATALPYLNAHSNSLRLANGSSGQGNVIVTVTPNWGGYASSNVTLIDPGSCTDFLCSGDSGTVGYTFESPRLLADLEDVQAVIPLFDTTGGKTLTGVSAQIISDINTSFIAENRSAATTPPVFRVRVSGDIWVNLDGDEVISAADETFHQSVGYPALTSIGTKVDVPASGTWPGDSISGSLSSTLRRLLSEDNEWLENARFNGYDFTQDPRWVTNATGDTTSDDDMYIHIPESTLDTFNISSSSLSTDDLNKFIGTGGNIPLTFNTLSSFSSLGGGGSLIVSSGITGSFKVAVTYTYTQPCYSLSGHVYNDGNGNSDGLVNHTTSSGTGINNPSGTQLYANLLDESGNVVAFDTVAPDGSYSFPDVIRANSYTVQLSTVQGVPGNTEPATVLPADWINSGEQLGTIAGIDIDSSDSDVDGKKVVTFGTGIIVSDINFGINKIPEAEDHSYTFSTTPAVNTIVPLDGTIISYGDIPGLLSGTDNEDGLKGGATSVFVITSLPTNGTLLYNGVEVTPAQVADGFEFVNPSLLSLQFTGVGYTTTTFGYTFVDAAGYKGSPANYTITLDEPLPVKLLSFNAHKYNSGVLLTWETMMEEINNGFVIERSDDRFKWEAIGFVTAGEQQKSNETRLYQFFDESPLVADNFYRLKQIESDASFSYSAICKVSFGNVGNTVYVYPNPVSENLYITGISKGETIRIYSLDGKLLRTISAEENTSHVNVNYLPSAVYYVVVSDKSGIPLWTQKIIKK